MKILPLREVIKFWLQELDEKDWFMRNARVDRQISDRFGALYESLASAVPTLQAAPLDTLASIIVLDRKSTLEEIQFLQQPGSSF